MVLGPHDFSIGARNCVVDQTLCTNKTDDDDGVNAAADVLSCLRASFNTSINRSREKSSPFSLHVLACTLSSLC